MQDYKELYEIEILTTIDGDNATPFCSTPIPRGKVFCMTHVAISTAGANVGRDVIFWLIRGNKRFLIHDATFAGAIDGVGAARTVSMVEGDKLGFQIQDSDDEFTYQVFAQGWIYDKDKILGY